MGSKTKNRLVDALYLALAIVPFLLAMTLKVLTAPATEGVSITGAMIFFTVDMPIQAWPVTEAQVNSLAVMLSMLGLCLYLTHGLQVIPGSKRQLIAEWIVEKVTNLVQNSMGERFMGFVPFIAAILGLSALFSLSSLLGLFPPTSDLNIVAGWAILVFILITYYKLQGGLWPYVKGFFTPGAAVCSHERAGRGGDACVHVLPSLRQRAFGRDHLRPGGHGAEGPEQYAAGLAARRAGAVSLPADRPARHPVAVL